MKISYHKPSLSFRVDYGQRTTFVAVETLIIVAGVIALTLLEVLT